MIKEKILQWMFGGIVESVKAGKANWRTKLALWGLQRMVDKMKGSWKTTTAGICAIVTAVAQAVIALVDGKPETSVNFEVLIASIMAGVGLIAARDNGVTSEEAGALKK